MHFLATLDEKISDLLNLTVHKFALGHDCHREEHFFSHFGPQVGKKYPDGRFEKSGLFTIVHQYDKNGNLLSRKRWVRILSKNCVLIKGRSKIYKEFMKFQHDMFGVITEMSK